MLLSPGAVFEIDDSADNEFFLGNMDYPINVKELIENGDDDSVKEYIESAGYECDFHGEGVSYWLKEDEVSTDKVHRCCWTREEADALCASQKQNGDFYSYSIMASGVLAEAMKLTCERKIKRKEFESVNREQGATDTQEMGR